MRRESLATLIGVSALLVSLRAEAGPTKAACIAAFDSAQQARREGALVRSHEDLLLCSQPECPSVVRADCAGVLRQVDAAQPTIVLKAADANHTDLTDVVVELDGRNLARTLDGREIPVDPGKLSLVFLRPPSPPVTVDIVIAEGEKRRLVRAELGGARMDDAPPVRRSAVGWTVPGGFVLLGASALTFAGLTRLSVGNEADAARDRCAPACPSDDRDRLSSRLVTANVSLAVGLGSLALAAITWLVLAPASSRPLAEDVASVR